MSKKTQQTIYKTLFAKTELKSEKINLNAVEDLQNIYDVIKQDGDNINIKIRDNIDNLENLQVEIDAIFEDIKFAREIQEVVIEYSLVLGIDIPPQSKVAIDQITAYESSLGNARSEVEASINRLLNAQDF
jgi:hypothetical protein|tara:strand:- start:1365 stop:1757 length:393 start_codon:yes stop_codon:yes gene_type:complete